MTCPFDFSGHVAILMSFKSVLFELYSSFCLSELEMTNKESTLSGFISALLILAGLGLQQLEAGF